MFITGAEAVEPRLWWRRVHEPNHLGRLALMDHGRVKLIVHGKYVARNTTMDAYQVLISCDSAYKSTAPRREMNDSPSRARPRSHLGHSS